MSKTENQIIDSERREFFQVAAKVAVAIPWLWSSVVSATPDEAKTTIKKLADGKPIQRGLVKLKVPLLADHGGRVKVIISVDSPMTEANHVKDIYLISDGNPTPDVVSFSLGPDVGKAEVTFYMRMAKTQTTYAVARMSDGSIQMAKGHTAVTVGGCN